MATLGLPQISITFKTAASTAVFRSSRGKVALILHDPNYTDKDGVTTFDISSASAIPSAGISDKNIDLVKKTLAGSPTNVFAFLIPPKTYTEVQDVQTEATVPTTTTVTSDVTVASEVTVTDPDTGETSTVESEVTVQSEVELETTTVVTGTTTSTVTVTATVTIEDALKVAADFKANYIANPTGTPADHESLANFVKEQRKNRQKTMKAVVANVAADSPAVVNFTTGGIKTVNPDYTAALAAVDGDDSLVDEDIPRYVTYTAAEYTGRIAGLLAGIGLDRSATYYQLGEIVSCATYDDIDAAIDAGQLVLFDEHDGDGVKIARGINSYVNFSATEGEDFRFIKIVESVDLIRDDIADNFKKNYVGRVVNTIDNKRALVSAINGYLEGLFGTVLDNSNSDSNFVEIDGAAHVRFMAARGIDCSSLSSEAILRTSTGTHVFLKGKLSVANAMEDLTLTFEL